MIEIWDKVDWDMIIKKGGKGKRKRDEKKEEMKEVLKKELKGFGEKMRSVRIEKKKKDVI